MLIQWNLPAIKALLANNNLPFEDIGTENQSFWTSKHNQQLLGCIGIERFGPRAILRSMAVAEAHRGNGIAQNLYQTLIADCIANQIVELTLLTNTAKGFFDKMGWEVVHRDSVHSEVKQSAEFSHLCPVSATVMQLSLLPQVAEGLFKSGFNCAQSAFVPFALRNGMDRDDALKLTTGFGAGMVYRAETCGAISGSMMAIGLAAGRAKADDYDARETTYLLINKLYSEFKKQHGHLVCQHLLGMENNEPESWQKAESEGVFEHKCPVFVRQATQLTETILQQYQAKFKPAGR